MCRSFQGWTGAVSGSGCLSSFEADDASLGSRLSMSSQQLLLSALLMTSGQEHGMALTRHLSHMNSRQPYIYAYVW